VLKIYHSVAMLKCFLFLTAIALVTPLMPAASINVSAFCNSHVTQSGLTVENISQTGAECAVRSALFSTASSTMANGSAVFSRVNFPASSLNVDVTAQVYAYPALADPARGFSSFAEADIDVSLDFQLTTPGAVRQGFLVLSQSAGLIGGFSPGGDNPQFALARVQIGPSLSITCSVGPPGRCSPNPLFPTIFPFTLGQTFDFHNEIAIQASGQFTGPAFIAEGSNGDIKFGFSLFEADGTTPVLMSEVPEPTTLRALLGAGLIGLASCLIRRFVPKEQSACSTPRAEALLPAALKFEKTNPNESLTVRLVKRPFREARGPR
jgi:hypothetical protein